MFRLDNHPASRYIDFFESIIENLGSVIKKTDSLEKVFSLAFLNLTYK